MAKRLYVGSLPYDVTDDQLRDMFTPMGKVDSATVIMDRYSGRSKGFGFVEMSTDEEANKAIEQLNGSQVGDRNIVVNEARPMRERRGGGNGGGFGGGNGGRGGSFSR